MLYIDVQESDSDIVVDVASYSSGVDDGQTPYIREWEVIENTGAGGWHVDRDGLNDVIVLDSEAWQFLSEGESQTLEFSYGVRDGYSGPTPQTAFVTITGVNDGPEAAANPINIEVPAVGVQRINALDYVSDPDANGILSVTSANLISGDANWQVDPLNPAYIIVDATLPSYQSLRYNQSADSLIHFNVVDDRGDALTLAVNLSVEGENYLPDRSFSSGNLVYDEADGDAVLDLLHGITDRNGDPLTVSGVYETSGKTGWTFDGSEVTLDMSTLAYMVEG